MQVLDSQLEGPVVWTGGSLAERDTRLAIPREFLVRLWLRDRGRPFYNG